MLFKILFLKSQNLRVFVKRKKKDTIFEVEIKKYLEATYAYLLGRKPDKKGFDHYFKYLQNTE